MSKKILIFAPCANWIVHHQLDCALGAALANRGCEVKVIGCDGLFERCLVKGNPPREQPCEDCKRYSTEWFSRFKLPVVQLSSLLSPEDHAAAREWAESLDAARFPDSHFRGRPLGNWLVWNLHADLLTGTLDFTRPDVQARARDFALHGALIAVATEHILKQFAPDHAICYSGTTGYYRVFFELCREEGVPILSHERGNTDGSFLLLDNVTAYERYLLDPPSWDAWKDVPLEKAQWQTVADLFTAKEQGRNTNFQQIHSYQSQASPIRDHLRLPSGSKLLLALASGDWEFGMLKAYGGFDPLWDTQIEWLIETARICEENGWHLVIRQHPLGAGKKTYPRATLYLSALIEARPRWKDHVRVIMPAENFNTYDLMRGADAVVCAFTSSGAEAIVLGLPVVCIGCNPYHRIGMDWVRQRDDYGPSLVRAMTRTPPLDEVALTRAFRYAHLHFYTIGSILFSSISVKNAYLPDFRLDSSEALQPGVDPQIDRVCEHILNGTPLHPLPPCGVPSGDEEVLVRGHRRNLLRQREAARNIPARHDFPSVTVWRLGDRAGDLQTETLPPENWSSRHKEVIFDRISLDAAGGVGAARLTIDWASRQATTPYVYLLPAPVTLDESALSQAVDLLEKPEHAGKTGVLFGCYLMEGQPSKVIGAEWNTATFPPDLAHLPPDDMPPLSEPMTVLGMVLWRRDKLATWQERSLPRDDDEDNTWCSAMLESFLDAELFVNIAEPVVWITSGEPHDHIINRADKLAGQGDVSGALAEAFTCQKRFGLRKGMRCSMASWLAAHDRHAEAAALLYADYRAGTAEHGSWDLLQRCLPELAMRRPAYADYASWVESAPGAMASAEEKFLYEKVLSLPRDARIIAIGADYGRPMVMMAYACVGTRRRILAVDSFLRKLGDSTGRTTWRYNAWRGNLRRFGLEPYVISRLGEPHALLLELGPDEVFDFAVIDSSQDYRDVLLEFEVVYGHVKPGGWIGVRDVQIGQPGRWRVWEQIGRRLLSDHQQWDSLAIGRKEPDVPWDDGEREWPGFMSSVARRLAADPEHREIGEALSALMQARGSDGALAAIEKCIADAPDALKSQFQRALTMVGDEPWLHRALSLMLQRDDAAAALHRAGAVRLGP